MGPWRDDTDLMQAMTNIAMKQSSRRGFLNRLGKAGLLLASAAAGFSLVPERASANNPIPAIDGYVCPGPADGVCDTCNTACISGGCKCSFSCSSGIFCVFNQCSRVRARCSWSLYEGSCYFQCGLQLC